MESFGLTILLWLPLLSLLVLLVGKYHQPGTLRTITIVTTAIQLIIAVLLFIQMVPEYFPLHTSDSFVYKDFHPWFTLPLGQLGYLSVNYFVAVDGLTISLLLLSSIVLFVGALVSHTIQFQEKGYYALYLLLCISIPGCFVAQDLFLFFLFFEFMLLPMYFLIGIWGGVNKEYAAIKFFIYTLVGSLLILVSFIILYASTYSPTEMVRLSGHSDITVQSIQQAVMDKTITTSDMVRSLSIQDVTKPTNIVPGSWLDPASTTQWLGISARMWVFIALLIGFIIKLPAIPFHTWLPDAHVEAPTAVSVVLAGILLKIGGYGLIRIVWPIFPVEAMQASTVIAIIGVVSIVYAAYVALAQDDLKKMIAYSSVSHMGFVLLGIASGTVEGISGAVYQLFSHGLISALLFILVGILYERTHDRSIAHYKGLLNKMPAFTVVVTIAFFASLGLPGMSGFIAEILVLIGAFQASQVYSTIPIGVTIVATIGLVVTAGYYLWTLQRMFFGKFSVHTSVDAHTLQDLTLMEKVVTYLLCGLVILFGVLPSVLLDTIGPWMQTWVQFLQQSIQ